MKSSFRILAACLAASLALVSCEKESTTKTDNGGEAKDGVRTITVSFSPSTRSALGNDGVTPHFTNGDQIMLANEAKQTETVTVTVSGNTATAPTTLTGELTAVYPASASTDGETFSVSSTEQDGSFAMANICTATIPDGKNPKAEFETQVSIFKFSVPEIGDKGIAYSPKTIKVISGGSNIAESSKVITITGNDGGAIAKSDGGFYYMAVLPGETISNLTFCSGEGMRNTTSNDKDAVLEENTIYDVALPVLNGHEYVELTIPVMTWDGESYEDTGSTKTLRWATTNVGASSSTEYGLYFAWGETAGHEANDAKDGFIGNYSFDWTNYPFSPSDDIYFNKYVPQAESIESGYEGFYDDKTTLEFSDDAARQNWGGSWRMPTKEEQAGLAALESVWDDTNEGNRFTDANGNSIFLPATGLSDGANLEFVGEGGCYWSSSLDTGSPIEAFILATNIEIEYIFADVTYNREGGFSVRPLSE